MNHYPFPLLPLPYPYDALEPFIDTLTMQLHHDRHLKTYVDNLNAALKETPQYQTWPLERLIKYANWLPEAIRTPVKNNAGGVYNHNFFFAGPTPTPDSQLSPDLEHAINATFGDFDSFKAKFKESALGVFGSGYAWLTLDKDNQLRIITTGNQETPLTLGMCPLLSIDVWEHAYYLKHYNMRADYIDAWFHVADLDAASRNFAECLKQIEST